MNRLMREMYPVFHEYQNLRDQLLLTLTDSDLLYTPGGANGTLGTLCREIGEIEHVYTESFKTWTVDWSYNVNDPELETSVTKLTAWYSQLDAELEQTLSALTDEQLQTRVIERGPNFKMPPHIHLEVYKEALLLFYGKASVYVKGLEKPTSERWQAWVG